MSRIALIAAFVLAVLHAAEPPSLSEIYEKALQSRKAQEARNAKFTWKEEEVRPKETKTYDVIMLEGENYRKLIQINGQPLDPKMRKKVDEELEKTRAERRKGHLFHKEVAFGGIPELRSLCDSKLAGEDVIAGRKAWRVEAEPKPDLQGNTKREEQILAAHHIIWFDQQDGHEVQRADTFFKAANGTQPGTQIERRWMRNGGDWVDDSLVFRYDVKVNPFVRAKGEVTYRYTEYKRYQVESTLTQGEPPE